MERLCHLDVITYRLLVNQGSDTRPPYHALVVRQGATLCCLGIELQRGHQALFGPRARDVR
jgi:hypothetical protein